MSESHDVTLAQEDIAARRAHKVVLCAASSRSNSTVRQSPVPVTTTTSSGIKSTTTKMPDTTATTTGTKSTKGSMMIDKGETMKQLESLQDNQKELVKSIEMLTKVMTSDIMERKEQRKTDNEKPVKERNIEENQNKEQKNETDNKECRKCEKLEQEMKEVKNNIRMILAQQNSFEEKLKDNATNVKKDAMRKDENNKNNIPTKQQKNHGIE